MSIKASLTYEYVVLNRVNECMSWCVWMQYIIYDTKSIRFYLVYMQGLIFKINQYCRFLLHVHIILPAWCVSCVCEADGPVKNAGIPIRLFFSSCESFCWCFLPRMCDFKAQTPMFPKSNEYTHSLQYALCTSPRGSGAIQAAKSSLSFHSERYLQSRDILFCTAQLNHAPTSRLQLG